MPRLPPELLLEIIANLRTEGTEGLPNTFVDTDESPHGQVALKNLSLATRKFRALAQPVLFERVKLVSETGESLFRARKLLQMINARPESGSWIRFLTLGWHFFSRVPGPAREIAVLKAQITEVVSQLFLRLTHLHAFQPQFVHITREIYEHLWQLPKLRSVHWHQASMNEPPIFEDGGTMENLAIEEVSLDVPQGESLATSITAIARLARCPTVREFKTATLTSQFVAALLEEPRYTFHNLISLQVHKYEGSLDRVITFTSACPNLQRLDITSASVTEPSPFVPREAAPALREIRGPLNAISVLVPGRPVERITAFGQFNRKYDCSKDTLGPLVRGAVAVKELVLHPVRWKPGAMDVLFELFPNLEVLKVQFLAEVRQVSNFDWTKDSLNLPDLR